MVDFVVTKNNVNGGTGFFAGHWHVGFTCRETYCELVFNQVVVDNFPCIIVFIVIPSGILCI